MKIKSISLSDFRNIEKEKIEFSDGVNLIYGHNAQGKTNALGQFIILRAEEASEPLAISILSKKKKKNFI